VCYGVGGMPTRWFVGGPYPLTAHRSPLAVVYFAAFTSFQISWYFSRRGLHCQKFTLVP
jgi:hypothetical protein